MIGTIRKHSKWLWGIIITATIGSFLYWGASTRSGGGGGNFSGRDNIGEIQGRPLTRQEFSDAMREVDLRFYISSGSWPDAETARRGYDPQRDSFFRILLLRKAEQLQVHVSLDTTAKAANELLRGFGRGTPVPLNEFVTKILAPRGMTGADFERYLRNEITIQQVLGLAGASGRLVTPQDGRTLYEREYQEYVTQAVFLHPTNYLSGVTSTPEALGQFFTNQLSRYRIPERVQVSYVRFPSSNYLSEVTATLNALTNLDQQLEMAYEERGGTNFYTEKSAADAKAEILKDFKERGALMKARAAANTFATLAMSGDTILAEHFAAVAKTNGLAISVTAPFPPNEAPLGLAVGEEFVRAAFALSDSDPIAGPVMGQDAAYVIAAHNRLPSEAPKYDDIKDRVASDYKFFESAMAARSAGVTLATSISNAMAGGKSFASACVEAKARPVVIPPFSLNATNVPDVERHMNLTQFKQVMFMTPVGHASEFVPANDGGGVIVFVQQKLPVDEARLADALPGYLNMVRQQRINDAVQAWVSTEGQRDAGFRAIMTALSKENQARPPATPN